jgi:hexosaminidase
LEEAIEVFEPKKINIGHDEMYSIGLCERCKGQDPVQLYVDDIKKTKDFLDARGIETWMWGEKLLDAVEDNGCACGGAGWSRPMNGGVCTVPALWPCRDRLPKGVHYLHWYWAFDENHDKVYHERGYDVVYGNFVALTIKNWQKRVRQGIRGGYVSNWGSFHEEYMQRNLQYLSLISSAYAFWCPDFTDKKKEKYVTLSLQECNRLYKKKIKHPIRVVHTTGGRMGYKCFYDGVFIEDEVYNIGNYELTYADGTTALLPVRYGYNITCGHIENALNNNAFREVSYATMPEQYGDTYYYACTYENPHPEKQIVGFRYLPIAGKEDFPVFTKSFDFGTPAPIKTSGKQVTDAFEFTIE